MAQKFFWSIFFKRSVICFIIIISLLFSCILRVTVIANSNYRQVQANQSSIKLNIAKLRGTIFDCNKFPLTNTKKKIIACVSPTPRAITAISTKLYNQELDDVLSLLKDGKPAICEVQEIINCDGIVCTEIYENELQKIPAIHMLGYTDSDNKGVSGIQNAYNDILEYQDYMFVRYACDSKNRILNGVTPIIENQTSVFNNGVITTLDSNIQNIVEKVSDNLGKGAIVISDAKTNKIRAITSRPDFTMENISEMLTNDTSPLFNRALGAYNVGSVFKPCIAAAGLKNSIHGFTYNCTGSVEIVDRKFNCHKHDGHGIMDLSHAIAHSCNTFFYNFAFEIGENEIYKMASNLNFGKSIKLCNGIYTAKGSLPSQEKLKNVAHLANFSIGQGDFTASPVSLLTLYSAIANSGKYYLPSIVESVIKNGKETKYDIGSPTMVFDSDTAQKIKDALALVITEGTGTSAKPSTVTAAGKTATAQTGKFENGREINSSWFCGFFPFEDPKYIVIVFCEDNTKATKQCAQIFAEIADQININSF